MKFLHTSSVFFSWPVWTSTVESCSSCRIIFLRSTLLGTYSLHLYQRTSFSSVTSASSIASNALSYSFSQSSSSCPDKITTWYLFLSNLTSGMDFNIWDDRIIASVKCKSVRKPHATLPDTPLTLTSASKYFQILPGPTGALQSPLRLWKSILRCSWKHQQLWLCIQDATRFDC